MIILITQFVILAFGLLCLYCEISDKYRDCNWHVSVRWVLMMASIVMAYKISIVASWPLMAQVFVLFLVCLSSKILYKKVLRRQLKIKNFRLMKKYFPRDFVNKIKESK